MLVCRCGPHIRFWPVGDVVQEFTFVNQENDDTGRDYLFCPRIRAPVSPTVARPMTLDPLEKPRQVVLLPPLFTRKVVLWCLETKEMQQVDVRCSGSRFPLSVPSAPHDWWLICVCRQGLYHEAHSPPIFDTVHATKLRCRGSPRHCNSRVLLSPLPCSEKSGGWRSVIDLSFLNFFQVTPTLHQYHMIKALIRSFLLIQGWYAHTWQIRLGLFASTEKLVPLGRLHTVKLYIASLNIGISIL